MGELVVTKDVAQLYLLVLSRKWMGMGEWHGIINGYCGSFPHSLLSTSKFKSKTVQFFPHCLRVKSSGMMVCPGLYWSLLHLFKQM